MAFLEVWADQTVAWLRGLAKKGGKGTVGNIDARCLGRIADRIEALQGQVAARDAAVLELQDMVTEAEERANDSVADLQECGAISSPKEGATAAGAGRAAFFVEALRRDGSNTDLEIAALIESLQRQVEEAKLASFNWACQAGEQEARAEAAEATVRSLGDALVGMLDALAMGPLDIAAKYGPDAHPDEAIVDAAHKARAVLSGLEVR